MESSRIERSAHGPARARKIRTSDETVRSVQRAFSMLSAFAPERPRATLTQIAQHSGLPTTTVARLLATLEPLGFLRRFGDGSYGLGIRLLQLGFVARQTFGIIDAAEPILQELNEATGENTNLAIRADEKHFTYVAQLLSHHAIRHTTWVGRTQPLTGTANGAALLGRVGPEGYVVTRKTFEPDVTAAAAPVRGADGKIVAAVSVTGPTYRITDAKLQRFAKLVVEAAQRVSLNLGAQGAALP
jgi:IclR family acetate operon transcriptional repressor